MMIKISKFCLQRFSVIKMAISSHIKICVQVSFILNLRKAICIHLLLFSLSYLKVSKEVLPAALPERNFAVGPQVSSIVL